MMERPIRAVPKPVSTKKGKGKGTVAPAKTVAPLTNTAGRSRAEINNANRNYGKQVERQVAKRSGGERTPGSGAIKNSVKNLEGDVRVRDADNRRDVIVIECKGCATLNPAGEHTFTLKRAVLDQMVKEADLSGAVGLVYLKWKGESFDDDYVVMKSAHFWRFLSWAKVGASLEDG